MSSLPTGTVTFLFTDIEGSTKLALAQGAAWPALQARHHAILRSAIEAHGGNVFQTVGDAVCAVFAAAPDALAAAAQSQRDLLSELPLKVRMGLHTGYATVRPDGDYEGYLALATVQRVMSGGFGGQVLLSQTSADLVLGQMPAGGTLRDLGEQHLKGLERAERLYQLDAPGLPHEFPPLASSAATPNNLPVQLTSFIGRESEINEVKRQLSTTRLLTLTGSGGSGKTRLSLKVAAELLAQFPDGVWFVELASLADPAFVPQTVASVLAVREQPGRTMLATLAEYLRDKQLLLILDNCEHLISTCANVADTVLRAAPQVKVLASSREALDIAGETTYHVPSLPSPNPRALPPTVELEKYAAVQLFVARAQAVKAAFMLNGTNAAAIAQICFRLDGIPLAIELAAARIKVFTPEQIAARLDDRFRLLTGGSRTALPRQQTLRSAIEWSYSLLSEHERILYRRLSVFSGGWGFDAAEAVCSDDVEWGRAPNPSGQPQLRKYGGAQAGSPLPLADILDLLTRLVEKSLVIEEEKDGEARYHMLETIRQYARDKLLEAGEGERVRNRHLEFFVQQADLFDANFYGPHDAHWFSRMETELDNVRAAVDWSIESRNAPDAMRLAGGLRVFWVRRHPGEAIERLGEMLTMPEAAARTTARARALLCYGTLLMFLQPDKYLAAREAFEEMLGIAKEVHDEHSTIEALLFLGWVLAAIGDNASAQTLLNEGLRRAQAAGDQFSMGHAYWALGEVDFSEEQVEAAQAHFETGAAVLRALNAKNFLGGPTLRLGQVALRRGAYEQSRIFIRESFALLMGTGDLRGVAMCFAAFAALRCAKGQLIDAVRLCGAVDALLESLHTGLLPLDNTLYEQTRTDLRNKMDAASFDAARAEGHDLKFDQAIALALEEPSS